MSFSNISNVEMIRKQNIKERNKLLSDLGLLTSNSTKSNSRATSTKKVTTPTKRLRSSRLSSSEKKNSQSTTSKRTPQQIVVGTRRSARLSLNKSPGVKQSESIKPAPVSPIQKKREYYYGQIPGFDVGYVWDKRIDCSRDGVHCPTVAGIHPGPSGAYSIVLSGGYEDEIDYGYKFIYTGCGGRDLKGTTSKPKNLRTGPQTKDQDLNPCNESLIKSVATGIPVRVIRGYKLNSIYAPDEGYRYDGLYSVKHWYTAPGSAGFQTYKFELIRRNNQKLPPWYFYNEI